MKKIALITSGTAAILAAFLISRATGNPFLQSYLFSWIFWLGISLGAQAILLMHNMTAGQWGELIRPHLGASAAAILPIVILALPILFGVRELYPWAHPDAFLIDPELAKKASYLTPSFFIARSVIYLLIWVLLLWFGGAIGSGLALVLWFLSSTFAMVDWVMSLEPHWFSTMYGLVFITAQAMSAMALALLLFLRAGGHADRQRSWDLGNILLAMVMVWTYIDFMQYLVIWSGNLPEEATWVDSRSHLGWQWLVLVLAVFQFGAPFFMLLFRKLKEHPITLGGIALLVLFMRVIDVYWLVVPAFHRPSALPRLSDLLCLFGIGAIWFWGYLLPHREKAGMILRPTDGGEP